MPIGDMPTSIEAPTSSHNGEQGHRILVSFALGDRDEMMYLRYQCEDPTCDWCVIEFGEDECKEIDNICNALLTHPIYNDKSQEGGTDATHERNRGRATSRFKSSQGEFFS